MESYSNRRVGDRLFLPMINNRLQEVDYEKQKIIGGTLDFIRNRLKRSQESNNLQRNFNLYPTDMGNFYKNFPDSLQNYRPIRYFFQRPVMLNQQSNYPEHIMQKGRLEKGNKTKGKNNSQVVHKWAKPLKDNEWIKAAQEVHYPIAELISPDEFRRRQRELNELNNEAQQLDPIKRKRIRENNKKVWSLVRKLRHITNFYRVIKDFTIASISLRKNKQLISQASKADFEEITKWLVFKIKSVEDFCVDHLTEKFVYDKSVQDKTDDSIFIIKNFIHQLFHELLTNITIKEDIPAHIKSIMLNYISNKVHLPDNFLSSFEFNRLEFDLNLTLNNMDTDRQAMFVCFIVLYRIIILEVMIHYRKYFSRLSELKDPTGKKDYREIISYNINFLCVVLHNILKTAFLNTPKIYREFFKDTHLFKRFVKNGETYNSIEAMDDHLKKDGIEFAERLPKNSKANEFVRDHFRWVNMYKMSAFSFCIQFVENITS